MNDLATWLLRCIEDDERVAREATIAPWSVDKWDDGSDPRWGIDGPTPDGEKWGLTVVEVGSDRDYGYPIGGCVRPEDAAHIARWDPARILADCAAKRRIVELHRDNSHECDRGDDAWLPVPCPTLRLLAQPYRDRAGYRPEWDVQ